MSKSSELSISPLKVESKHGLKHGCDYFHHLPPVTPRTAHGRGSSNQCNSNDIRYARKLSILCFTGDTRHITVVKHVDSLQNVQKRFTRNKQNMHNLNYGITPEIILVSDA